MTPHQLYEFNGCIFHGCLCIKARWRKLPKSDLTAAEAYKKTMERQRYLESKGCLVCMLLLFCLTFFVAGYTVHVTWGCEVTKQLREDKEMAAFFRDCEVVAPLNPRDAFYGW